MVSVIRKEQKEVEEFLVWTARERIVQGRGLTVFMLYRNDDFVVELGVGVLLARLDLDLENEWLVGCEGRDLSCRQGEGRADELDLHDWSRFMIKRMCKVLGSKCVN